MTRRRPFVSASRGQGIEVLPLWELDNSRIAEGLKFPGIIRRSFLDVPGGTLEIRHFFHVDEALSTIGLG